MSSPIFPGIEQILDILFAELPDGVYATDRADNPDVDKRSYSSSEIRAHAQIFANLYENLLNINRDKFLTTVTVDGLAPWEKELFASAQDSSKPFSFRQQNLISKWRSTGGISLPYISSIIHSILDPVGLTFEILPYSGQSNGVENGAWILNLTPLGKNSFLSARDPLFGEQQDMVPLDCNLDYAAAGITAQDLADIQATAYTYEVQIFGNASAEVLSILNKQLTALEPARSTHVITNNASGPVDPDVLDLGAGAGNTLIDAFDFGDGSPATTSDVWDFGVNSA